MKKRLFKKLVVFMMVISVMTGVGVNYVSVNAATDPYLLAGHWDKNYVSIYIDDTPYWTGGGIPSYYYIGWRFDIVQAIGRWSMYLNDQFDTDIHFLMADSKASADIVIQYGYSSSWAHSNNYPVGAPIITSSIITLDDWDLKNYNFDTYTVTNIVTHELGHSLGLAQITLDTARANNIHSVMVEDVFDKTYFNGYPTVLDEANLLKIYP